MKPVVHPLKLFLFGTVLAVASTVALSAFAQPTGTGKGGGHGPRGAPGPMAMMMSDRVLDNISATPEQRTQIKQIMQTAQADLKVQHDSGRALREQTMQLFTQPTVDARAAETLRQQMVAQHDQASKRSLQAMLDASRVLSPEQRQKLAESLKQRREMMDRHQRERGALEAPKS